MVRMIQVIAARLLEGSLVPYLGPGLHRAPSFPAGPEALAAWLMAHAPEPGPAITASDLAAVAGLLEQRRGRRALVLLLREAFAPATEPTPLHLLLAGLPHLPLAVSAFLDGALLDLLRASARAGGRSLALVHGVSPLDGRGVFFAEAEGEGLLPAAEADTVLYQPRGAAAPSPSFLVTEADLADTLVALEAQAPIPPEVQRRREGAGVLFAGCPLEGTEERLFARGLLAGAAGPHFAVLPGPPTQAVERFLAAEGITALPVTQERFVAELSQALAQEAGRSRSPAPFVHGDALPPR
jgi:hypothetical protein